MRCGSGCRINSTDDMVSVATSAEWQHIVEHSVAILLRAHRTALIIRSNGHY